MLRKLLGMVTETAPDFEPDESPRPLGSSVRLLPGAGAVRIELGGRELILSVERTEQSAQDEACWLVGEPSRGIAALRGFVRVSPGETVLIGRDDERVQGVFDLPSSVSRRHLELSNEGGALTVRNLAPDRPTLLSSAVDPNAGADASLLANLARLRAMLGGRLELLAPERALDAVQGAIAALRTEPHRSRDRSDRPGGLLDLPGDLVPVILGDLHGRVDNLLRVLCEDGCLDAIESGRAYLLLLGDTVHREDEAGLEEMESSLLMIDLLCQLKSRLPGNVFWLRGNHESFDENVGKSGVPQGVLLRRTARERRGAAYEQALGELFDALPYVARSDDFVGLHAGAPRRSVSYQDLVEIRQDPALATELTWVRPKGPGRPTGFGKRDVARFRAALGVAKDAQLIVGHTPPPDDGVLTLNAADIPGLHVIYDSRAAAVPVFTRLRGGLTPLVYRPAALLDSPTSPEGESAPSERPGDS